MRFMIKIQTGAPFIIILADGIDYPSGGLVRFYNRDPLDVTDPNETQYAQNTVAMFSVRNIISIIKDE